MAKVIIVPSDPQVVDGQVLMGYGAAVIGPSNFSYGADYKVNTGISVGANLIAWKNKIIGEVAEQGVVIIATDVIVFGIPT